MTHAQGSLRACPSTCTAPASASSSCKQLSIEPAAFAAFVAAGNYGPASESSGQGGSRGVGVSRRLVFGEAGSCHAEVAEQQRDMLPVLPPSSTPKATDGSPAGSSAAGHPAAAAALVHPAAAALARIGSGSSARSGAKSPRFSILSRRRASAAAGSVEA